MKLEDIKKGTSKYSVMALRWQGSLLTKKSGRMSLSKVKNI
jgi:hypothetical protein